MARTAQTDTARFRPVWHKKNFTDHAGRRATRIRYSPPSKPIPENFKQTPVFVIQVYTTVPMETSSSAGDGDEAVPRRDKRTRGENDADVSITEDLKLLIQWLGGDLSDVERPPPVWEIYEQQPDVLSCVNLAKREIAHRKAYADDNNTFLIPTLSRGQPGDERKTGFCIIVTSDFYKLRNRNLEPQDASDEAGPLWLRFHRPAQQSTRPQDRQRDEEDRNYPEAFEVEVEHKQRIQEMQSQLAQCYFFSCVPKDDGNSVEEMDFALEHQETVSKSISWEENAELIQRFVDRPLTESLIIDRDDQMIHISNNPGFPLPAVRYIVYIVLEEDSTQILEAIGRSFTDAIMSHLAPTQDLSFEFRRPSEPNLSAVLKDHHGRGNEKTAGLQVGYLPSNENREEVVTTGRRIFPLARDPASPLNDASTCGFEPYRTFLLVIDTLTDFETDMSGVLFLLTDGGKGKMSPSDEAGMYHGPKFDFLSTAVWRCRKDTRSLVERLAPGATT